MLDENSHSRRINRATAWTAVLLLAAAAGIAGCHWQKHDHSSPQAVDLGDFSGASTEIEYPDVEAANYCDVATTPPPITLGEPGSTEFWDMTLEDAIRTALRHSKVLRDLGGLVLQSPENVSTIHDPALAETHPQFGMEAALSAFDANWSTSAFFEKNDRALNNQFFGGGTRVLKQDLLDYNSELTKRSAVGTDMTLRHNMVYDFNNAPGNNNPNLPWSTNLEAEVRQSLLQGAGAEFNRIAGPGSSPGIYNGMLIARVNTDIQLTDFEMGVRNLVNDVETVYWELYYAYRELDAKLAARDRALETWRIVKALGGRVDADKEAQAREQYFRLEEEAQNALGGRLQERTRQTTFRGTAGVHQNERKLRLLIGVPINDGKLIRPANEPQMANVVFDWEDILSEALVRRPEIRRQKWRVKQRELELVAARNFIKPQLDLVGRYRWRGLGHDLLNSDGTGRGPFDNAADDLLSGDFQEWQVGMEFSFGVGRRQGYAAVRHAELNLARDAALLDEQQRDVSHDLSNAIGEIKRAYLTAKLNYNRRMAAKQQLAALEAKAQGSGDVRDRTRYLDLILDAQRRLADAESKYYRSLVEYMMAIKAVHYSKGSLLSYNEIHLAEGAWPEKAYHDAARRARLRMRSWKLTNFVLKSPPPISHGPGGPGMHGSSFAGGEDFNPNPAGFDHAPEKSPEPIQGGDYLKSPPILETTQRNSQSESMPSSALSSRRVPPDSTPEMEVRPHELPIADLPVNPTYRPVSTADHSPLTIDRDSSFQQTDENQPSEYRVGDLHERTDAPSEFRSSRRRAENDRDDSKPPAARPSSEAPAKELPIPPPASSRRGFHNSFQRVHGGVERHSQTQPSAMSKPPAGERPAAHYSTDDPPLNFELAEYFGPLSGDQPKRRQNVQQTKYNRLTDDQDDSDPASSSSKQGQPESSQRKHPTPPKSLRRSAYILANNKKVSDGSRTSSRRSAFRLNDVNPNAPGFDIQLPKSVTPLPPVSKSR